MYPSRIQQLPTIRNPDMSSSSLFANPTATADRSRDSHRAKKKRESKPAPHNHVDQTHAKWKTRAQHQLYSSKLHEALVRINADVPRRFMAVRDAADSLLAVAAKGRTRWSRAILINRLKLNFRKAQHKRYKVVGPARPKKPKFAVRRLKTKTIPAVQKKVRVLGGLIPGCRKEPLPVILDEARDYIPALEMQVRALQALSDYLLGSSSAAASTSAPLN